MAGSMVTNGTSVRSTAGNGVTRVRHHEEFKGLTVSGITVKVAHDLHRRFNVALKLRAESA